MPMELKYRIESAYLYADANVNEIKSLCIEAKELGLYGVVVSPFYVKTAALLLRGSYTKAVAAVSYPLGQDSTAMQAMIAKDAAERGAQVVEVVLNHSMIKAHDWRYIMREVSEVEKVILGKATARYVIESSLLSAKELYQTAASVRNAGGKAVVSGTPFGYTGVKSDHIKIIRNAMGENAIVKATGAVLSQRQAKLLLKCGASLIGTSDPLKLL